MIVLAVVLALLLMLGLGDPDVVGRINAYWVIGAFVALLATALVAVYVSPPRRGTGTTQADGAKAVGGQLLRALLLLIGIFGLLLVIGVVIQ